MSSSAEINSVFSLPILSLQYQDIGGVPKGGTEPAAEPPQRKPDIELSNEEFAARIARERAEAAAQAEQKLRQEYEASLQAARAPIAAALTNFESQRIEYFSRVEAEVVQLALAIAAKILHREAQVDPMLVATLVRMAIEKMREGSSVTVRGGAGCARRWKEYFAAHAKNVRVEVVEDPQLSDHDCVLETELGSAHFGLDTQLKEVEQGFFDLLALRPVTR
jgi:flagellar assembly protein FliH